MSQNDADIPPGVDFLSEEAARKWAEEAEQQLGSRINIFDAFVQTIVAHTPAIRDVLELGSGPGFLAEYILSRCACIERYTLLDFSPAMLEMSRIRLQGFGARVAFLQIDFKLSGWVDKVGTVYDCNVTIQAVHELRHKRHAPRFYKECRHLLNDGGLLLVCDRLPQDDADRNRALFMTEEEQLTAIREAGLGTVEVLLRTPERVACKAIKG
jgi:SAM-dependent methyltransferase